MQRTRHRVFLTLTAIALLSVAALGCGTSSPSSSSDETDAPAIAATVHIKDGKFDPREVEIEMGGSVMWINDDVATHDLKFMPPNKLYSGVMKPKGMWIHTFSAAGTYDYYCDFHNTMKGSVVVRPAP